MGSVDYCQLYSRVTKTSSADRQLGNFIVSYGPDTDSYKMVDMPGHCLVRLHLRSLFDEVNVASNVISVYAHILNREEAAQSSSRYFANASVVHRIATMPRFEKKSCEFLLKCFADNFKLEYTVVELHRCQIFLFPVVFKDQWLLIAIDTRCNAVDLISSVRDHSRARVGPLITRLNTLMELVVKEIYKSPLDLKNYVFRIADVPHQSADNSIDSGVFLMKFMRHWDGRLNTSTISVENVRRYRVELANEIVRHPQNSIRDKVLEDAGISVPCR